MATLDRSFFSADADIVARHLLGATLVHDSPEGRVSCRIVETEAYFGPPGSNAHLAAREDMPARLRRKLVTEGDPASHAFSGVTPRNGVMFGPAGIAYVYLIYGMYDCVNVVTGPADEAQAVLLRAGEPVEGSDIMMARRHVTRAQDVASGPGKLACAMAITRAHSGMDVTQGALQFEPGPPVERVDVTPRIGVVGGEDLPLRFVARDPEHVSRRSTARAGGRSSS